MSLYRYMDTSDCAMSKLKYKTVNKVISPAEQVGTSQITDNQVNEYFEDNNEDIKLDNIGEKVSVDIDNKTDVDRHIGEKEKTETNICKDEFKIENKDKIDVKEFEHGEVQQKSETSKRIVEDDGNGIMKKEFDKEYFEPNDDWKPEFIELSYSDDDSEEVKNFLEKVGKEMKEDK